MNQIYKLPLEYNNVNILDQLKNVHIFDAPQNSNSSKNEAK